MKSESEQLRKEEEDTKKLEEELSIEEAREAERQAKGIELVVPERESTDGQQKIVDPPLETTITILDADKNFRAYISLPDGGAHTCYNKYGEVTGCIHADENLKGGLVEGPAMKSLGIVGDGGWCFPLLHAVYHCLL